MKRLLLDRNPVNIFLSWVFQHLHSRSDRTHGSEKYIICLWNSEAICKTHYSLSDIKHISVERNVTSLTSVRWSFSNTFKIHASLDKSIQLSTQTLYQLPLTSSSWISCPHITSMIEKALLKPLPFNFFETCLSVNEVLLGSINIKLKNNNKYLIDKGHLPTRRAHCTVQAHVCVRVCVFTVPREKPFAWCACSMYHIHPGYVHKFGVHCRSPEICQNSGPDPQKTQHFMVPDSGNV